MTPASSTGDDGPRAEVSPGADPAQTPTPAAEEPEQLPLWQQATIPVLTLVVNTEIDVLLGRPVSKEQALTALAARREIVDRLSRYRWAIETARQAGAGWDDIDRTLHRPLGQSRREHQPAVVRQQQLGLGTSTSPDSGRSRGSEL